MKIKLKRFLAILTTATTVLCAFSSCAKEESSNPEPRDIVGTSENTTYEQEPTESESEEITEPVIEPPTEAPRLSDECDKVLAIGYSTNGSFYELVANETEDYNGTRIVMGVIENNSWLIPLTSDSPFISDSGLLVRTGGYEMSIFDKSVVFDYVGSDCFTIRFYSCRTASAIWNIKNNIGYVAAENDDYELLITDKATGITHTYDEGIFMLQRGHGSTVKYLKTDTMDCCDYSLEFSDNWYPFSNGLFAVQRDGFYNLKGERVISLDDYDIYYSNTSAYTQTGETITPCLIFNNNKCDIPIKNDQGTNYIITIDTTGKVINSVKVD